MNILFSIIHLVTKEAEKKNADTKRNKANIKGKYNKSTSDAKGDVTYLRAKNTACTTESASP